MRALPRPATRPDAARSENRSGIAYGIDDLRPQHHRRNLTGVATCLVALGDDDVDAVLHVSSRMLDGAGQGGDRHTFLVRQIDDVLRRRPESIGYERRAMRERHVDVGNARPNAANPAHRWRVPRRHRGAELPAP